MTRYPSPTPLQFAGAALAMALVVLASNILVQFPINDWLTWGAFSYPVAFLVSDLVNRRFGPPPARRVAYVGFAVAVAASLLLAPVRIALASGLAFIASQLLDIGVFDRLRRGTWWRAPLVATLIAAVLDSLVFWGIAFGGTDGPWLTWALGDLGVKLAVGVLMLLPFRLLIGRALGAPPAAAR
ncbi:VUT family protein [Variovorax sp. N23]|uniref:VUT family protein n=1 Tax=Variovorax sp. N23 TaxID=2980555 RepID=UPI0021C7FC29|nr:VUT family protein [Variovorax sp. N23]MCU4121204.1 VUT family protein [Variovorax sp. N23]